MPVITVQHEAASITPPVTPVQRRKALDANLNAQLAWSACLRSSGSTEVKSDWIGYVGYPYADFDICSSCFNTSIKHTKYARFFQTGATRQIGTSCDFSKFWVRQAWIWIVWRDLSDASPLLSASGFTGETPCPNVDPTKFEIQAPSQQREWFSIVNPATGHAMSDVFALCSACLRSLETIMPILKGMLRPSVAGVNTGTCDIIFRRPRSWNLVDKLMDHAGDIEDFQNQNASPIVELLLEYSRIPDCQRHLAVRDAHYRAPSISEFTVCQSCFNEVIAPDLQKQELQANALLLQFFGQTAEPRGEFVCRLYSERTRKIWREAIQRADVAWFRQQVVERIRQEALRNAAVRSCLAKVAQYKAESARYHQQGRIQATISQSMSITSIGAPYSLGWNAKVSSSCWTLFKFRMMVLMLF